MLFAGRGASPSASLHEPGREAAAPLQLAAARRDDAIRMRVRNGPSVIVSRFMADLRFYCQDRVVAPALASFLVKAVGRLCPFAAAFVRYYAPPRDSVQYWQHHLEMNKRSVSKRLSPCRIGAVREANIGRYETLYNPA